MSTRTLKFKTTEASPGFAFLQCPGAPVGSRGGVITYAVIEIPETVTDAEVARLFNKSVPVSLNLTFLFSDLGEGNLLCGVASAAGQSVCATSLGL